MYNTKQGVCPSVSACHAVITVADPGFPVGGGGVDFVGGVWTPETVTFWKKLYVKMKESGPLGGVCRARPL